MTPPELRALLADSLLLWGVAGGRTALAAEGAVEIAAAEGMVLRVSPAPPADHPVRWWLDRSVPGTAPRRRPCTGITGLLRGLRNALLPPEDAPSRLRMAAAPPG